MPRRERDKMKHTIRERLEAGLKRAGYSRAEKRDTSKYRAWHRGKDEQCLFVGSSGALRKGKVASNSFSLQYSSFYKAILNIGDAELSGLGCIQGM